MSKLLEGTFTDRPTDAAENDDPLSNYFEPTKLLTAIVKAISERGLQGHPGVSCVYTQRKNPEAPQYALNISSDGSFVVIQTSAAPSMVMKEGDPAVETFEIIAPHFYDTDEIASKLGLPDTSTINAWYKAREG